MAIECWRTPCLRKRLEDKDQNKIDVQDCIIFWIARLLTLLRERGGRLFAQIPPRF